MLLPQLRKIGTFPALQPGSASVKSFPLAPRNRDLNDFV